MIVYEVFYWKQFRARKCTKWNICLFRICVTKFCSHHCRSESRKGLWIILSEEAIQLAYGTLTIPVTRVWNNARKCTRSLHQPVKDRIVTIYPTEGQCRCGLNPAKQTNKWTNNQINFLYNLLIIPSKNPIIWLSKSYSTTRSSILT